MKKMITLLAILMAFFSVQPYSLAAEEKAPIPYFGVGANVQELENGAFLVKTEGLKAEEGFVFTPKEAFTSTKISLQILLKGKGTVLLRISETDPRGRFIKEKTMEVALTEDWAMHVLPFQLASTTSQIDVSVVTKGTTKTEFSYKNLIINQE